MSRRVGRWCDHVPPATAVVECGGEDHRITWRRGKLVLEDHDLSAELAMVAFGGQPCACLRALQLWRNLHSWSMSGQLFQQMTARLGSQTILAPGRLAAVHELGLMLTWERTWKRSAFFSDHERLLKEQLQKRALEPLRAHLTFWKDRLGSRRISSAEVEVQRAGRPAVLNGSMDTVGVRARAVLGTAWALRVWARGAAVVDGAFVLEIVDDVADPDEPVVRAVRWEEQGAGVSAPVAAAARLDRSPEGTWRLTWEDAPRD